MRSAIFGAAAAAVALLTAAPAFANCSTDIARVERSVDTLRPGPNTRAAVRHLRAAKAARSEATCRRQVRDAAAYAERSARADRTRDGRYRRGVARSYPSRYDERPL
jgi:hypothetical protein